jgi:RNA polymerase sigma-70 factor (ECF subfamily)
MHRAADASPFECAARAELGERVVAALRTLPEAFREVVVLREIEGFGYEEIAEMLGVNLGTVKSRLTRGRAALREALRDDATRMSIPVSANKAARVVAR